MSLHFYASPCISHSLNAKLLILPVYLLKSNQHLILERSPVSTATLRRQWNFGRGSALLLPGILEIVSLFLQSRSWGKQGVEFLLLLKSFIIDNFRGRVLSAPFGAQPYFPAPQPSTAQPPCSHPGYTKPARTGWGRALQVLCDVLPCKSESQSGFKPVKCSGNLNNDPVMGAGACSTCWMFILLLTAYTFILQCMKQSSPRKSIRC